MEHFGQQLESSRRYYVLPSPGASDMSLGRIFGMNESTRQRTQSSWGALCALLRRDWFDRLWVVQEILYAREGGTTSIVRCGDKEVSLPHLRRACLFHMNSAHPSCPPTFPARRHVFWDMRLSSLRDVLLLMASTNCSVDQDRLYGLLSMISPGIVEHIRIDYSKAAAVVFEEFSRLYLEYFRRLDLLIFIREGLSEAFRPVPTWVSTLQSKFYVKQFSTTYSRTHFRFLSRSRLAVVGSRCGRVRGSPHYARDGDVETVIEALQNFDLPDPSSELLFADFASTLALGCLRDRYPEVASYPTLEEWKADLRGNEGFNGLLADKSTDEIAENCSPCTRASCRKLSGLAIFQLEDGSIGVGPRGVLPSKCKILV